MWAPPIRIVALSRGRGAQVRVRGCSRFALKTSGSLLTGRTKGLLGSLRRDADECAMLESVLLPREFRPRFPDHELDDWAQQYDAAGDNMVLDLVPVVQNRGFLSRLASCSPLLGGSRRGPEAGSSGTAPVS